MKTITKKEYMADSSVLHHDYYSQFVTQATISFVRTQIGMKRLLASTDKHLNDVSYSPFDGGLGSWMWDFAPINMELARELGEVSKGGLGSPATHTCISKAAARQLIADHKEREDLT
jgi:hypothetical protein